MMSNPRDVNKFLIEFPLLLWCVSPKFLLHALDKIYSRFLMNMNTYVLSLDIILLREEFYAQPSPKETKFFGPLVAREFIFEAI